MEEDWDLQAVVRGCAGGAAVAAMDDPFSGFPPSLLLDGVGGRVDGDEDFLFCFPDLLSTRSTLQELEDLYKPFFSKSPPDVQQQQQQQHQKQVSPPLSPLRSPSSSSAISVPPPPPPPSLPQPPPIQQPHPQLLPQKPQLQQQQQPKPVSQSHRSKRRKNQQKRVVCHVAADGLSSDIWAWRKYGQKPIKGSPYPRGYYRCSSSKGCLARKQLERSRADSGMFVITYTAEHNHPPPTHRNSLAGSTRHKFPSSPIAAATQQGTNAAPAAAEEAAGNKACSGSPLSSLTAASAEDELVAPKNGEGSWGEEGEGLLMVSDMEVLGDDDMLLFLDLDELRNESPSSSPPAADSFDGRFTASALSFSSPWMAGNSTAPASGES